MDKQSVLVMKNWTIRSFLSVVLLLLTPVCLYAQQDIRLIDAVERGDLATFRAMLDLGVDVNGVEVGWDHCFVLGCP